MWTSEATVEVWGKSVKGWLSTDQHLSQADAGARITAARGILERDQVAEAFKAGEISRDHAKTLTQTLRNLPEDVQDFAEKELTDVAKLVDPASLARACKDLRDRLDLDGTEEEKYAKLYGHRYVKTAPTIDGMLKIDAMLDPATAAAFTAALAPLRGRQGADDIRSQAQRDHDALALIIANALRGGDLSDHGGMPPQVVVTTDVDTLTGALDAKHVSTTIDGVQLPASAVRMLACDAGIIPAVMRGKSEVLDLGRTSRTWNKAQRIAAKLRDGETCVWPGDCTIPIRYCELHHLDGWVEHHGSTDHNNSAHLCRFHHWLIHNREWTLRRDHDGVLHAQRRT
jgi:hypothetical protein